MPGGYFSFSCAPNIWTWNSAVWYNMRIFMAGNGRMAIHTMCGLRTWYNMRIFMAGNGRMAIHTMIEL